MAAGSERARSRQGSCPSVPVSGQTLLDGVSRNHEQTSRETGVIRQRQRMGEKRSVGPGADTPDKITHAANIAALAVSDVSCFHRVLCFSAVSLVLCFA